MPKRSNKTKTGRLFNKAWNLMSHYVRLSQADFQGYVECYTCWKKKPLKEMQAGHYHHRKLDFDLMNVHPQCPRCNSKHMLNGNLGAYGERLVQDYGMEAVIALREKAQQVHVYTISELETIITDLKRLIGNI